MKLSFKFGLAVLIVVALTMAGRAWWLIGQEKKEVVADARERALTVLSFGEACRQYARETLSPAVRKHAKAMIFEADSATFVARGTFAAFRQRQPSYSFREAALNPLNPENMADAYEEKLIRKFEADPNLKELSGFRHTKQGEIFYVARPIPVQKVCLQCHDTPEAAPKELVERYGTQSGFGWKVGDLTSAIIVTVPARAIYEEQARAVVPAVVVFVIMGVVLVGMIFFLFRRLVSGRLQRLSLMMNQVAQNPLTSERLQDSSGDELGQMSQAFNVMADALGQSHVALEKRVEERTAELQRENQERRRAEEQLQRTAQELSRSNRDLEQFAYVASHDLQEPLRMVSSYMDLLSQRYQGELDEKARRWIEFAVDGSNRMKQLITDLLEWSRMGSRGHPFAPTDCNQVVKTVLANLQVRLRETGGAVEVGALPVVSADASQLTQLFQNLLTNSLKYRGPDPPRIKVTALEGGDHWLFAVKDNGIGIEPQYAERIFVIFQRLHTRQDYPGTGIGLALCKKVVERHGGRIWVEAQLGQGATFFFTLAKNPPPPTQAEVPPEDAP